MENKIKIALDEISRGTSEIIDIERITLLLKNYYDNGTNYFVKAGFDPTAPDLHLGHTVLLQKLAIFQKYGGIVQFLIGNFTATIGDPTGKNITRKVLSDEDITKNIGSYTAQAFKILDESKTEIVYNKDWLEPLGAAGMLSLASNLTVARMLERDDFSKRYASNSPIALSEFMYPLLQGYDSVYLKSDIEIGGTDQKFNLLMGRQLQKVYEIKKQQAVLMMPILEGLDGVNKMSKSLGNYIGVTDLPNDMFGKVLSISDDLMWRYYELLSNKTMPEIAELQNGVNNGTIHPKSVKDNLAIELVDRFHGRGEGLKAKEEFTKIFANKDIPTTMEEFEIAEHTWICQVLVDTKLVTSTSQARRDIESGAVKIDQVKLIDSSIKLEIGTFVLQKGKKSFVRINVI
ncbi:MAG: tyrosine--tRNA ligase [Arcobacteraceae bacterium]|jgi:tyrosyl-tRNA synthetase